MQTEIKSMDVRLGVLNHTVLQYKSKERNQDKKFKVNEAEEFEDNFQWFPDVLPLWIPYFY